MLARWYLLLGQFSVTFEYRPGSQHSNADGMSRQCGQFRRPDCPVSAADLPAVDANTQSLLVDQPFASSEMGDSMDSDLLPELSVETWVASALLEELTVDLPTAGSDINLVTASRKDKILQTVRSWVQSGNAPPWPACAGLSPELRCWRLQVGNLTIDSVGRLWRRRSPPSEGSQLVVPVRERQELIRRFHDSLFTGHLGVTRTIVRLLDRVYWPGLRRDVRTYIASCTICLARKSPCPRRAPMGHVELGHRWERVAMQELCILCGSHKTRTTPCHPESDGMVERFNRTLLMMLAMFAGKNRADWDDLLPAVMMEYRSSVHESTGFSPYRLMFGEECTLPMDIGLPKQQSDLPDSITSPYAIWVRDALEVAYEQVRQHSGQAVQHQKRLIRP